MNTPTTAHRTTPLVTADDLYPADIRTTYLSNGTWTTDTLADLLPTAAATWGDRPAAHAPSAHTGTSVQLTYTELHHYAATVAQFLHTHGIGPHHRVVMFVPNTIEYLGAFFGTVAAGAVPIHALAAHGETELAAFIDASGATAILTVGTYQNRDHHRIATAAAARAQHTPQVLTLTDPATMSAAAGATNSAPEADAAPAAARNALDLDPCGLGLIQLSGGTTGVPKLIGRSHADYLFSVRTSADICHLNEHTRMLVVLPAAHNFTMSSPGILGVISRGGMLVFSPDPTPSTAFKLIEAHHITITSLVPPLAMLWLKAAETTTFDISSLEVLQVGGAKFAPTAAAQVRGALNCTLQQVFGMAEGLVNYTRLDDKEELITTTQGYPMTPLDEVRVLDDAGHPVPPGSVGHLWTRGPYTIRGYLGGVSATSFDEDGFYCTGDMVRQLPSGHLIVEGRSKELINRAGEKISCEDVENAILTIPGVADCLVLGRPDPLLGEKICAVIIPTRTGSEAAFTTASVRTALRDSGRTGFTLPDEVFVRDSFPTTKVGKAARAAMADILSAEED